MRFGGYVPHDAWKVFASYDELACLLRDEARTVHAKALDAEHKLASVLQSGAPSDVLNQTLFRFVVHYMPDDGSLASPQFAELLAKRVAALTPIGIDISSVAPCASAAASFVYVVFGKHGDEHAIRVARFLAAMPDVAFVEPLGDTVFHLANAKAEQWNGAVGAPMPTWLTGAGQLLGIADQGVGACGGQISVKNGGTLDDPHGTAMAWVAASRSGIAPSGQLFLVAVERGGPLADIGNKLRAALDASAFVVMTGAGTPATSYNSVAAQIDKFAYENDLALPIVAAGNTQQLTAPAFSKNALVVGSVGTQDKKFVIGAQSPRSGTADRRNKPDVVAPGEGLNLGAACTVTGTGTSLAAAAAAGAALIARQYYVDGYYPTGEPTPEQKALGFSPSGALLKATLVHAAVPVSAARDPTNGVSGAGAVPSAVQGFGRIQLDRALYVKGQSPFNKMSVSFTQELDNGGSFSTCINVAGTRALRATLAWMDVEADVMAGHTLVNDLDLAIYEIATGRTWRGNNAAGFDHANTVESITIDAPAVGKYKIVVHGVKLAFKQPFGLIITGDYADENCVDSVPGPNGFVDSFPYNTCPNGCSSHLNECVNGVCSCATENGIGIGFDCSLAQCAEDCGLFGECDFAVGACRCVEKKRGPGCALSFENLPPEEVFETKSTSETVGYEIGLFVGLLIFLYFLGCICAGVIGIFGGTKYLEWKRDRAMRA